MGMNRSEPNLTPISQPANPVESATPVWFKNATLITGVITMILGAPLSINLLCIVPLVLLNSSGSDSTVYGIVSLSLVLLTLGAGSAAFIHANRSLQNKPSKPLQLNIPPVLLVGIFFLLIGLGISLYVNNTGAGLVLTPILITCAILPPLWSVLWMIPRAPASNVTEQPKEAATDSDAEKASDNVIQPSLSWRQGVLSFTGGATVSVFIALVLEILLPVIILSLVFNLADTLSDSVRALFRALSNADVAEALTNSSFIYIFIQIAVIAPLAEEFAKPLVTLPLLRTLNHQQAFWIGALAGAGFAALENVIYATSGFSIWAGILVVRALGGAVHPLGSGLVAQGWRAVLLGEKDSGKNWWKRFGLAVAAHAVWNGGSLLVITLGGARFFGELPPEIDLLGLSAAGTTLAFLVILGIAALWVGRVCGHGTSILSVEGEESPDARFIPSDRALALWAVTCLIALVPAGIAGLKLWLR
jgi:RsiW-degrading membrane proteinase PrsW (M82 family)